MPIEGVKTTHRRRTRPLRVWPQRTWANPSDPGDVPTPLPEREDPQPLEGGAILPGPYRLVVNDESVPLEVEMVVGARNGKLVCQALAVPYAEELTLGSLRRFDAYLEATKDFLTERGVISSLDGWISLPTDEQKSVDIQTTRRGRPKGPDRAQAAADLWHAAEARGEVYLTKAVAEAMRTTQRQAQKYLKKAEERGLVPPRRPGRPKKLRA